MDPMLCGPNGGNLAAQSKKIHPVDYLQRVAVSSASLDLDAVRRIYGSGLAMRLATERSLASRVGGRLPGMDAHPDSNAMLDTLTGSDLTIGFEDILNVVQTRPESSTKTTSTSSINIDPHTSMEAHLGI